MSEHVRVQCTYTMCVYEDILTYINTHTHVRCSILEHDDIPIFQVYTNIFTYKYMFVHNARTLRFTHI